MPTVLVVDDDWAICEVIDLVLSSHGYDVVVALGAKRALAALAERRVDVILLDVTMPITSGPDLLLRLKRSDEHRAIPVILMTAFSDAALAHLDPSLVAGFLRKPFSFELLTSALSNVAKAAAVGQ